MPINEVRRRIAVKNATQAALALSKSGIKAAEKGHNEVVKAWSGEDTRAVLILAVIWILRDTTKPAIVVSADLDILCDTGPQAREFHEDLVH
jgi:hypothetical protein